MMFRLPGAAGPVRTTVGDDLDEWPIVVTNRDDKWWHFDGGFLDFPVGICDGSLKCSALPEYLPKLPAIEELQNYERRYPRHRAGTGYPDRGSDQSLAFLLRTGAVSFGRFRGCR